MGYDAYHLVANLFGAREQPMEEFVGATGTLYLAADGRIHRRLAWAQFVNGAPEPLPTLDPIRQPVDDPDAGYDERGEWREMPLDP